MSLLLYINGQLMDLDPSQVIAQTKQVNDLNSLDDRQAGYTNKFKLPKTANNIRTMEYLTLSGNISNVPYQKNECSLYSDSGECFVYKGRAVITDAGDAYEAVIYDGVIDLFKAIENTTLDIVGLEELTHTKDTATVMNSWVDTNLKYRYIAADFNGDNRAPNLFLDAVSIDYQVPSVNVAYLWDKVFNFAQFTYSGSVFQSDGFKNLWITYPKGVSNFDEDEIVFEDTQNFSNTPIHNTYDCLPIRFTEPQTNHLTSLEGNMFLKVAETGEYRLELSGALNVTKPVTVIVAKNAEASLAAGYFNVPTLKTITTINQIFSRQSFNKTTKLNLSAGESICILVRKQNKKFGYYGPGNATIKLTKMATNKIDFNAAFSDFSTTDFLKEIVHRFGLTMYKDKYTNHYHFLTLKELLETQNVADWSNKFAKKLNEAYIYGSYAQRNWFRYNYNDKEASHNDYFIEVPNANLAEGKDVIKSKIYSPELNLVDYLRRKNHLYKLWDKEVVENPEEGEEPITYNSLDKRYYFLRSRLVQGPVYVYSKATGNPLIGTHYYEANYSKLPFYDIVAEYYAPLEQVLNKALIVNAELYLKESDIVNFDFKKLYYFSQLSGYFIINKINNYVPDKITKCELLRVKYTSVDNAPIQLVNVPKSIAINAVTHTSGLTFSVDYGANFRPDYDFIFQYSGDSINWRTALTSSDGLSPKEITVSSLSNANYFRILYAADKVTSNIFALN